VVPEPAKANSSRFNFPSITAPALDMRRATSASSVGTRVAKILLAAVVSKPAVSMLSFNAMGTPCNDPRNALRCSS
jgi:hypothetical protein